MHFEYTFKTNRGGTDMACTSLQNVGVEKILENADIGNLI